MRELFEHFIREEGLFCKSCSAVSAHAFYGKNLNLSDPNHKLISTCNSCGDSQVYFLKDLRFFTPEASQEFSCKIAGHGRLTLDDWVYVPGDSRPGKVKSRIRSGNQEVFTLSYEDGTERSLQQDTPNIAGKEAMIKYKLLPFQLSSTLVGDHVYHVNRNKTGQAVGLIRGPEDKLILALEDESFLIMTLPESNNQILGNRPLKEFISTALESVPSFNSDSISLEVSNGIVYLNGKCRHLMERETLVRFIESMDSVLVVISKIKVAPKTKVSDSILQKNIQELLYNQNYTQLMGLRISVEKAIVEVSGYISEEEQKQQIYDLIIPVHGIVEIKMMLKKRSSIPFADQEKNRLVVNALKKNGALASARISVQCVNGIIYLEGEVHSNLQKSTASFAAMWAGKNLNVVNNLKIVKSGNSDSFIHMVE
jgi:osmotically-inducible protein OsmY